MLYEALLRERDPEAGELQEHLAAALPGDPPVVEVFPGLGARVDVVAELALDASTAAMAREDRVRELRARFPTLDDLLAAHACAYRQFVGAYGLTYEEVEAEVLDLVERIRRRRVPWYLR